MQSCKMSQIWQIYLCKLSWTEMICVKKLTFCNSENMSCFFISTDNASRIIYFPIVQDVWILSQILIQRKGFRCKGPGQEFGARFWFLFIFFLFWNILFGHEQVREAEVFLFWNIWFGYQQVTEAEARRRGGENQSARGRSFFLPDT